MYDREEYIQLPPLKRELEANVVLLIWEFAKMSEEARKEILEDMELISSKVGNNAMPEKYRTVTEEELADYEDALGRLMRSIVFEASDIACWVFCKKYIDEWSLEQMIEYMPFCLVDFATLDIYPIQKMNKAYSVGDYWVELDHEDSEIEIDVYYLPER